MRITCLDLPGAKHNLRLRVDKILNLSLPMIEIGSEL
jgi:hypothetical protein